MKSLPIPMSTVEAYGAIPVKIDPPQNFELNNGQPLESLFGMKVGEVVYVLMGIEENEKEALFRTNCFYIGFMSGVVPVFITRVADIVHGKTNDPTEPLPILFTDYQLGQEARNSWPHVNANVVYKQFEVKTELREEEGPDSRIIEAGDYLFHDFSNGRTFVVDSTFAQSLIQIRENPHVPEDYKKALEKVLEEETRNNSELQQPVRNGELKEE